VTGGACDWTGGEAGAAGAAGAAGVDELCAGTSGGGVARRLAVLAFRAGTEACVTFTV
jgi:hypothetical protein